jgi:hypothetical protein
MIMDYCAYKMLIHFGVSKNEEIECFEIKI